MITAGNKEIKMLLPLLKRPFKLTVTGNSMSPILQDGEIIEIQPDQKTYKKGDIVVFYYKEDSLIVHRILKVINGRYYCKGDNSFRIEDVLYDWIIGKVNLKKDPNKTDEFIIDSLKINEIFRQNGYNINKTKNTKEYKHYKDKYLKKYN